MKSRLLLPLAVLSVFLVSCDGSAQYSYLRTSDLQAAGGQVFWFEVNLSKDLSYTSGIAMRYYTAEMPQGPVDIDVYLISPSGKKFIERVQFPLGVGVRGPVRQSSSSMGGISEIEWQYRSNIRTGDEEAGVWRVGIEPVRKETLPAIDGFGFFCKKENGKR